jgi:hypothetical protein
MKHIFILLLVIGLCYTSSCPGDYVFVDYFSNGHTCNSGRMSCKNKCILHAHLQTGLLYRNYNCGWISTNRYMCCCEFLYSCYGSDCIQELPDLGPNPFKF